MKSLKQIQEEELKLVDKTLSREEISKLLVEYSMPTRQVFISKLINRINRFILSAMEASARGAIEATRIKWEPAHTYSSENADLYRGYDNGFKSAISDQATKAKDYLGDTHD